jgi:hypothetical protein
MADKFVVVTVAGYPTTYDNKTYWQVLADIHMQYMSAGGNWDRPNMLIRNGEVVIASDLASEAYKYGQALYDAQRQATAVVQAFHKPAWL